MNVVDASVAFKWVYDEPEAEIALQVLRAEPGLTAPALWLVECANVLTRKHREGKLDAGAISARLDFLRSLPLTPVDDASLLAEGAALSLELHHPLYDCLYLALARRESDRLITADYEFAKVVKRAGYGSSLLPLIDYRHP